jgi:hypothetical protein
MSAAPLPKHPETESAAGAAGAAGAVDVRGAGGAAGAGGAGAAAATAARATGGGWLGRVAVAAAVGGALLHFGLLAWVVGQRIDYPYELEWIEGSSAATAQRVLDGLPIYVPPSLEFTPYLYTPLYFWLSAACAHWTGMSLLPLRLVSSLAALGCLVLVGLLVRREARSRLCGLLAAGLYAACFKLSGYWYDVGRVDSLFLFWLVAGVYALRAARGPWSLSGAAALLVLAFLTKQSALFFAAPLALWSWLAHRGVARWVFPAAFGLLVGVATAVLSAQSDGWFYYYVFDMPRGHPWSDEHWIGFWSRDLLRELPIAIGVAGFWLLHRGLGAASAGGAPAGGAPAGAVARRDGAGGGGFYAMVAVGLVGCAWLSRLHAGSAPNVLMPAYLAVALGFGLGLRAALGGREAHGGVHGSPHGAASGSPRPAPASALVLVLAGVQLALLLYDPRPQVPTAADRAAGDRYIAALAAVEGDVFVSHPAFLTTLAGKKSYSDGAATGDIFRSGDRERADQLREQIVATIRAKRFAGIVVSKPWLGQFVNSSEYVAELERHYEDRGPLLPDDGSFFPVTGLRTARPDRLYVRKP